MTPTGLFTVFLAVITLGPFLVSLVRSLVIDWRQRGSRRRHPARKVYGR